MKITENVPLEKMGQFHEILCSTGGWYLQEPLVLPNMVVVCYNPGNYTEFCYAWRRCTTPITEVRKDQWWRKVLRKFLVL